MKTNLLIPDNRTQTVEVKGEQRRGVWNFYSNHCSVKSVEYWKIRFISIGSPLVALEKDAFKLIKGCLSEKIEPKYSSLLKN